MASKLLGRTLLREISSPSLLSSRILSCKFASQSSDFRDVPTHTGQQFDKHDYRLARFIDKQKHVNTKFAIDLINQVPPEPKKDRVVWCDGGGGPTGHPKVYINLDKPGNHTCGYCGLRFYKEDHHH